MLEGAALGAAVWTFAKVIPARATQPVAPAMAIDAMTPQPPDRRREQRERDRPMRHEHVPPMSLAQERSAAIHGRVGDRNPRRGRVAGKFLAQDALDPHARRRAVAEHAITPHPHHAAAVTELDCPRVAATKITGGDVEVNGDEVSPHHSTHTAANSRSESKARVFRSRGRMMKGPDSGWHHARARGDNAGAPGVVGKGDAKARKRQSSRPCAARAKGQRDGSDVARCRARGKDQRMLE